jgi:hypothetical protein
MKIWFEKSSFKAVIRNRREKALEREMVLFSSLT